MRISDWSSDVCSSDLAPLPALTKAGGPDSPQPQVAHGTLRLARLLETPRHDAGSPARRAACRGRGRIQRQRLPQAAVGQAQGAVRRPRLPPAHRRPLRRVAPRAELSALGPQEVLRLAGRRVGTAGGGLPRSEEHTSELQSLMRISYAVFCLKKKKIKRQRKVM